MTDGTPKTFSDLVAKIGKSVAAHGAVATSVHETVAQVTLRRNENRQRREMHANLMKDIPEGGIK